MGTDIDLKGAMDTPLEAELARLRAQLVETAARVTRAVQECSASDMFAVVMAVLPLLRVLLTETEGWLEELWPGAPVAEAMEALSDLGGALAATAGYVQHVPGRD